MIEFLIYSILGKIKNFIPYLNSYSYYGLYNKTPFQTLSLLPKPRMKTTMRSIYLTLTRRRLVLQINKFKQLNEVFSFEKYFYSIRFCLHLRHSKYEMGATEKMCRNFRKVILEKDRKNLEIFLN